MQTDWQIAQTMIRPLIGSLIWVCTVCFRLYLKTFGKKKCYKVLKFQPLDVLKRVKGSLTAEKLATVPSAKAFLELLKSLRGVGKDRIAEVMTSSDSYYIV